MCGRCGGGVRAPQQEDQAAQEGVGGCVPPPQVRACAGRGGGPALCCPLASKGLPCRPWFQARPHPLVTLCLPACTPACRRPWATVPHAQPVSQGQQQSYTLPCASQPCARSSCPDFMRRVRQQVQGLWEQGLGVEAAGRGSKNDLVKGQLTAAPETRQCIQGMGCMGVAPRAGVAAASPEVGGALVCVYEVGLRWRQRAGPGSAYKAGCACALEGFPVGAASWSCACCCGAGQQLYANTTFDVACLSLLRQLLLQGKVEVA